MAYEAARISLAGLLGGFLTIVAAGFAAYYARRAYLETKRTADLAKQSLEIETRPFIYLDGIDWKERVHDNGSIFFEFVFKVKNAGHLPAMNLRLWTSVKIIALEHKPVHTFDDEPLIVEICPKDVTRKTFATVYLPPTEAARFENLELGIAFGVKMLFDTRFKRDKCVEEFRWAHVLGMREDKLIFLAKPTLSKEPDLFEDQKEAGDRANHDTHPE